MFYEIRLQVSLSNFLSDHNSEVYEKVKSRLLIERDRKNQVCVHSRMCVFVCVPVVLNRLISGTQAMSYAPINTDKVESFFSYKQSNLYSTKCLLRISREQVACLSNIYLRKRLRILIFLSWGELRRNS